MELNTLTGEELAQLQIELTKAIFNYCESLARFTDTSGKLAPQDVRDFTAYLQKQRYKYDKKIIEQENLITLLDIIGSHSKAEWYNHIYRYNSKDYDLQLIHQRRSDDEDIHDEEEAMMK